MHAAEKVVYGPLGRSFKYVVNLLNSVKIVVDPASGLAESLCLYFCAGQETCARDLDPC